MRLFRLPKSVLAVALSCALIAGGCTASQISAYINLAAQIAMNVLTITSAFAATSVSAHDTALVASFQSVLQSSVTSFEADKTAGNSALVSVAMAAESNIPAWLAAAQFDNPALQSRITVAATSFITVVEAIAATVAPNVVVPPPPPTTAMHMPARLKISVHDIANQWNNVVCAGASPACQVK